MRASYGRSCSASTHLCTQRRGRATLGCWLPASNIRASVPSCSRPRCYAFWGCNLGRLKLGEPINANGNEIWTERRGQGATSCSSRGSATPPRRGSQLDGLSERYLLTAFDNRGAGARRCPRGASRRARWPTTPPRCCARWRSRAPTSPASRWEAPSRRSWPFATPSRSVVLMSTYAR